MDQAFNTILNAKIQSPKVFVTSVAKHNYSLLLILILYWVRQKMPCIFCDIHQKQTQSVIYKDDKVFAFHDISKASFTQHILVCPIQHSESALHIKDTSLITHMQNVGTQILDKINGSKNYRFGFHLGWNISVPHTHLHCFALPYTSVIRGRLIYGYLLHSVQTVINKIKSKQSQSL